MSDILLKYDNIVLFEKLTLDEAHNLGLYEKLNYGLKSFIKISSLEPINAPENKLAFCITVDATQSQFKTIRGPRSKTDDGNKFKEFWAKKCLLRHVDGDLFECASFKSKRNIVFQIIDFVMKTHFPSIEYRQINGSNLKRLAKINDRLRYTQIKQRFLNMILDKLQTLFHSFNEYLPLSLKAIHPVSAGLRSTQTFQLFLESINIKTVYKRGLQDLKYMGKTSPCLSNPVQYILVELESSSKWPKSLKEFLLLKKLFLIRFKEILNHHKIASKVVHTNMLDVYTSGLKFRLYFYTPVELSLTCGLNISDKLIYQEQSPEAKAWLLLYKHLPFITSVLKGVTSSYGSFVTEGVRLVKRWITSIGVGFVQMPNFVMESNAFLTTDNLKMDVLPKWCNKNFNSAPGLNIVNQCQMSEIAVELLVLQSSGLLECLPGPTNPSPNPPEEVTNPSVVLLRFLNLLANFDWSRKALVINLNSAFSDEPKLLSTALKNFDSSKRENLPPMVLITPDDLVGSMWTETTPTTEGFNRLQTIAKSHLKILRAMFLANAPIKDFQRVLSSCPVASWSHLKMDLKRPVVQRNFLTSVKLSKCQRIFFSSLKSRDLYYLPVKKYKFGFIRKVNSLGIKYWSAYSDQNPLDWLISRMQKSLGNLCNFYYDPFGLGPIYVEWKGPLNQSFPFEADFMDGLTQVSTDGSVLSLAYNQTKVFEYIKVAFNKFISSYEFLQEMQDDSQSFFNHDDKCEMEVIPIEEDEKEFLPSYPSQVLLQDGRMRKNPNKTRMNGKLKDSRGFVRPIKRVIKYDRSKMIYRRKPETDEKEAKIPDEQELNKVDMTDLRLKLNQNRLKLEKDMDVEESLLTEIMPKTPRGKGDYFSVDLDETVHCETPIKMTKAKKKKGTNKKVKN